LTEKTLAGARYLKKGLRAAYYRPELSTPRDKRPKVPVACGCSFD